MKKTTTIILVLIAVILSGCSTSTSEEPRKGTDWTIMFYIDGDNDLEYYLLEDIQEMKLGVIDNQGLNIVVLIDRSEFYSSDVSILGSNFSGAKLYWITSGAANALSGEEFFPGITPGTDTELNMGDAQTLKKFIEYCKTYFPANKYALIFSSHGNGASKKKRGSSIGSKTICHDMDSNDSLSIAEITDTLDASHSVDLLGFDACLMGSVEVAYQFRPGNGSFNAQVMVASPAEESVYGWSFDHIFPRLQNLSGFNGQIDSTLGGGERYYAPATLTAQQLAAVIVEEQRDFIDYANSQTGGAFNDQTISAYDLTKVAAVKLATDTMITAIHADGLRASFELKRGPDGGLYSIHYFPHISSYFWTEFPVFDLYDLAKKVNTDSINFDLTIRNHAASLMTAVDDLVLYSFAGNDSNYTGFVAGRNGIHIFFPNGSDWDIQQWYNAVEYSPYYGRLAWCRDGAIQGNGAENWFEVLDLWYDSGNSNNYTP